MALAVEWKLVDGYAYDSKHGWLHRLVVGLPPFRQSRAEMCCDHIDRDRLNNKRDNLRIVTHAENMRNRRPNALYSKAGKWLKAVTES